VNERQSNFIKDFIDRKLYMIMRARTLAPEGIKEPKKRLTIMHDAEHFLWVICFYSVHRCWYRGREKTFS